MNLKTNRSLGLLMITIIYLIAIGVAWGVNQQMASYELIQRIFWADLAATIIVYLAGTALNNATVYDPYWSVAPIVILVALVYSLDISGSGVWLLLFVITLWGGRLTANWIDTFQDLNHQDWRYDLFRERFPRAYPLISLAGIHLFPTLIVFFALIPAIQFLTVPVLTPLTVMAAAICLAATILQSISDRQMRRFRRERASASEIIQTGVWKYARHPNYLAEIIFWWGIYLFLISANPQLWYLGFGALLNTLMFLFISIPMAEKRLAREKAGYDEYRERTRMLLPLKRSS